MPISRQKKEETVKKVADALKGVGSVVFVNFHGLKVSEANTVRRKLRGEKIGYIVAKKTLIKRALSGQKISGTEPVLEGELAVAYSEDAVAPAKHIVDFQKKFENHVAPLGGILENRYISAEEVKALAKIPSREVLYGQFVRVINSPIQQTVVALNAVVQSFVVALSQIAQKKS